MIILCAGFFVFGFGISKASAATYYVANAGNDACNGQSQTIGASGACAWKTIAKVNASSFSPGDSILFNQGDTWREQLNVSRSGTSDNPFIFGAYGNTGVKPIINGADLTTNSWSAVTDILSGWTAVTNPDVVFSSNTGTTAFGTFLRYSASFTAQGQGFKTVSNCSPNTVVLKLAKAGLPSGHIWVEIQLDTSVKPNGTILATSNSIDVATLPDQGTVGFAEFAFAFAFASLPSLTATTQYHIVVKGDFALNATNFVYIDNFNSNNYVDGPVNVNNGTAWSATANKDFWFKVITVGTPIANKHYATSMYHPTTVTFNGISGTEQASIAAMTTNNDWHWESNTLYVYSDSAPTGKTIVATNPIAWSMSYIPGTAIVVMDGTRFSPVADITSLTTNKYYLDDTHDLLYAYSATDPDSRATEVSARSYGVNLTNKDYVTIFGLDLRYSYQFGAFLSGTSDHDIIDNCDLYHNHKGGLYINNDGGYHTISGNTSSYNGYGFYSFTSAHNLFTHNYTLNNMKYTLAGTTEGAGIGIENSDQTLVEYNDLSGDFDGINLDFELHSYNATIRYNYVHNGQVGQNGGLTIGGVSANATIDVYNNIVIDSHPGILISYSNVGNINIFNNTIRETTTENSIGIGIIDANNITLKNNIVSVLSNQLNANCLYIISSGTIVSNHNVFYLPNQTNIVRNVSNNYSAIASWAGASGQDANSIIANPLITSSSDFHLLSTSPAINAGTSVGLTTDFSGNPIYGTPDIGAYEYQPPYTMGTDEVDTAANVRVYGDGKFQNMDTAGGTTANLSIDPISNDTSQYLDVDISTWETTGTREKQWIEASANMTGNVSHTVGDLEPNKYYNITADNATTGLTSSSCDSVDGNFVCQSDTNGQINFTWTGGYSTHTFTVTEGDNINPIVSDNTVAKFHTDTTEVTLSLTTDETSTCHYGTVPSDSYAAMTSFTNTNSTTHTTVINSLTPNTYTYYAICQDSNTNETTHTLNFEIAPKENDQPIDSNLKINSSTQNIQDKHIYSDNQKITLKGQDDKMTNGEIKIYKDSHKWKTLHLNSNGEWNKGLNLKDNHSTDFKITYYDQYGTELDSDSFTVNVDTQKPTFTTPLPITINKNQPINFEATDNQKISYYRIKILDNQGHIIRNRKQTKDTYLIPITIQSQAETIIVRAYDKAGNYQEQKANLI